MERKGQRQVGPEQQECAAGTSSNPSGTEAELNRKWAGLGYNGPRPFTSFNKKPTKFHNLTVTPMRTGYPNL